MKYEGHTKSPAFLLTHNLQMTGCTIWYRDR